MRRPVFRFAIVFFLAAILCLALCLYFATKGAFGGVFLPSAASFTLSENETVFLSDSSSRPLPEGAHTLTLKNGEGEPLSFLLCQEDAVLARGSLSPREEKSLTVQSNGASLSLLLSDRIAFVSDEKAFSLLTAAMPRGGDLIFLSQTTLSGTLSAPFRFFGRFSFEEFSLATEEKGVVVFQPDKAFSAPLYLACPRCKVYFDSFCLPDSDTDYYLKAKSLDGKALTPSRVPVSSFEKLRRLADPDRLPSLSSDSHLQFVDSFSVTDDTILPLPSEITFSSPLTFEEATLSFSSQKEGTVRLKTERLCAPSPDSLRFDAPLSHLVWEAAVASPSRAMVEKYSNLASYNGRTLALGGTGTALPTLTLPAENVTFRIEGNRLLAVLPYSVSTSSFSSEDFSLSAEGGVATLSDGIVTTRDAAGQERRYVVEAIREPKKIPVVHLSSEAPVESKTQYVSGSFALDGGESRYDDLSETHIRIRGRGNSSWKWEKKPYKIHFDEPTSLLGLPAAEEWALLSNYADKSLMRNRLAQVMASTLSFEYCPTQVCVDVFLNGEYQGVYTLGEHLEAGDGRVEVKHDPAATDCGFFLEAGGVVSGVDVKGMNYFHADLVKFVLIKDPDYNTLTSEQFEYIRSFLLAANEAVKAGEGYEAYLDPDTLVDWMIMIELSCNTDCSWRRSTYFTKNPGEKLKMGPVWDFDLAFGNFSKDNAGYDTWVSTEPDDDYVGTTWSTYLLEDPAFRSRFKARWQEVGESLITTALEEIEHSYDLLAPSAEENFARWDILGRKVAFERHDTVNYKTYSSQIYYLQDFLIQRGAWIDAQIESW